MLLPTWKNNCRFLTSLASRGWQTAESRVNHKQRTRSEGIIYPAREGTGGGKRRLCRRCRQAHPQTTVRLRLCLRPALARLHKAAGIYSAGSLFPKPHSRSRWRWQGVGRQPRVRPCLNSISSVRTERNGTRLFRGCSFRLKVKNGLWTHVESRAMPSKSTRTVTFCKRHHTSTACWHVGAHLVSTSIYPGHLCARSVSPNNKRVSKQFSSSSHYHGRHGIYSLSLANRYQHLTINIPFGSSQSCNG